MVLFSEGQPAGSTDVPTGSIDEMVLLRMGSATKVGGREVSIAGLGAEVVEAPPPLVPDPMSVELLMSKVSGAIEGLDTSSDDPEEAVTDGTKEPDNISSVELELVKLEESV